MGFISVLTYAHKLAESRIRKGDIAIDATLGNGNDTAFLAEQVGQNGMVYGFDIVPKAVRMTSERLQELGLADRVQCFLHSHAQMDTCLPASAQGNVAAVMFNLGYLPGSDKTVITKAETTIAALKTSLQWLKSGGIITIVAYPGHPGGQTEAKLVQAWAAALPAPTYQVLSYEFINSDRKPPFLIAIMKKIATLD